MTTNEMTARELREQAHEVAQLEAELVAQLDNLPFRVAEAREAARQRYAVMYHDRMAGRSTEEPYWDYSEAEAIEASRDDIATRAKQYGIDKFDLTARAYRLDAQEHQEAYDSLGEPERELEREYARVGEELKKVREARGTADSRRRAAVREAVSYERAAAFHRQSDDPQARRMM